MAFTMAHMVSTWRDRPDCPSEWDEFEEWRKGHRCIDCERFYACSCGECGFGWCSAVDDYVEAADACCEDAEPVTCLEARGTAACRRNARRRREYLEALHDERHGDGR